MKLIVITILSLTVFLSMALPVVYLTSYFIFNYREKRKEVLIELMKDINVLGKFK